MAQITNPTPDAASHVSNNTALESYATTMFPNGVWRDTYGNGNTAPPLFYTPAATCPWGTGIDGASCVASADSKVWVASFPATIDLREFGARGDAVTPISGFVTVANGGTVIDLIDTIVPSSYGDGTAKIVISDIITYPISSMSWSSTGGGQLTVATSAPTSATFPGSVQIENATNTGTGGSSAINGVFAVASMTNSQNFVLTAPASAGVFGTLAGGNIQTGDANGATYFSTIQSLASDGAGGTNVTVATAWTGASLTNSPQVFAYGHDDGVAINNALAFAAEVAASLGHAKVSGGGLGYLTTEPLVLGSGTTLAELTAYPGATANFPPTTTGVISIPSSASSVSLRDIAVDLLRLPVSGVALAAAGLITYDTVTVRHWAKSTGSGDGNGFLFTGNASVGTNRTVAQQFTGSDIYTYVLGNRAGYGYNWLGGGGSFLYNAQGQYGIAPLHMASGVSTLHMVAPFFQNGGSSVGCLDNGGAAQSNPAGVVVDSGANDLELINWTLDECNIQYTAGSTLPILHLDSSGRGIFSTSAATFSPNNLVVITATVANTSYSKLQVWPVTNATSGSTPNTLSLVNGAGSWAFRTTTLNSDQLANLSSQSSPFLAGNSALSGGGISVLTGFLDNQVAVSSSVTIDSTYGGDAIYFNNNSATIAPTLAASAPGGTRMVLVATSTFSVTIAPASGAKLNGVAGPAPSGDYVLPRNEMCLLECVRNSNGSSAEWFISGAVSSVFGRTGAVVAAQSDYAAFMYDYIAGLTLSTAGSSSTFGIAVGVANDSTNAATMQLASAYTKTTSAWTVGSGNGALDTGTIAASTWYHVHLIERTDTGVVDVLVSLSLSSPTLPSSYTLFRRIGSMLTDSSSHWVAFSQNGDEFLWATSFNDVSTTTLGTTATLETLTVPTGLKVNALMRANSVNSSAANEVLINSPDENATTVNAATGQTTISNGTSTIGAAGQLNIRTNTSAQVRVVAANASTTLRIATIGWIDTRGKNN